MFNVCLDIIFWEIIKKKKNSTYEMVIVTWKSHNVATLLVANVLESFYRDIYAKREKERNQKPFNMQNGTFNSDTVFLTNMYVYEYFNTQFINVEPIIDLHCVMYISNTVLCHIELQLLID